MGKTRLAQHAAQALTRGFADGVRFVDLLPLTDPSLLTQEVASATRGQVRSIIRWEATLTSMLGAVIGATLGLTLAWIATQALPADTAAFTVPVLRVSVAVTATTLLGVAASVVPALRASRMTCSKPRRRSSRASAGVDVHPERVGRRPTNITSGDRITTTSYDTRAAST